MPSLCIIFSDSLLWNPYCLYLLFQPSMRPPFLERLPTSRVTVLVLIIIPFVIGRRAFD